MRRALFAVVLAACCGTPLPPSVDGDYPARGEYVEVFPDNSVEAASSPCGRACARLSQLGCPESNTNQRGATCYQVCTKAAHVQRLPLSCVSRSTSVAEVRACGFVRCVP
jgi:hypothetical protein